MTQHNHQEQPEVQPENAQPVHRRRPRYKGTHPRKYEEKYKERDPEHYQADIEKMLQSGKTPVGMHIPICVEEILAFLQVKPGQIGLDATLGYGGHSQRLLEALQGQGHLYATDVDPIESEKTRLRLQKLGYGPELLTVRRMNFARLDEVAPGQAFHFVLADLGVSSMQIDNPQRGFSFKSDGPLDLRLDPLSGTPASARLQELTEDELTCLLTDNADEPYAASIAHTITGRLSRGKPILTTRQLAECVDEALSSVPMEDRKNSVKKSCQRVFQALRIDVNGEFEALYSFLEKLPGVMKSGGRVAILTFHSGEDRMVKKAFQQFYRQGIFSEIAHEVTRPSAEECFRNPRARSAKLRWAIRS